MMRNRGFLKLISLSLAVVFLFTNITAFANAAVKKETVYVILDAGGRVKSQIVTDWIHSDTPNATIKDKSELENIVNLKGDESPQKNGEYVTWKLNSNDLFYQGTISKELPFEVSIKYYLDGKEIKPQDLAGKSGKVKIKIEVANKEQKIVKINGKNRTIYLPLTFAAVVNLPLDKFENVKTNAGEVITEGNTQAVVSVLFPGLLESLGLDGESEIVDVPKYIEITADCKHFELSPIYMVATNKLLDIKDVKKIDSVDSLQKAINTLYTSSEKILEGAVKLSNGEKEFTLNFEEFTNGLKLLSNASSELYKGVKSLEDGAEKLYNSSKQLRAGTSELNKNSQKLYKGVTEFGNGVYEYTYGTSQFSDGAIKIIDGYQTLFVKNKELFDAVKKVSSGLDLATSSQKDLEAGSKRLQDAIQNVLEGTKKELEVLNIVYNGFDTVISGLQKLESIPLVKDVVTNVIAGIDKQRQAIKGLIDSKQAMVSGLSQILENVKKMSQGQENLSTALLQLKDAQAKIASSSDLIVQNQKVLDQSAAKLKDSKKVLDEGTRKLLASKDQLVSGTKAFCDGTEKLDKATAQFVSGTGKLKDGAKQLSGGMVKFDENMKMVYSASEKLLEGSKELEDGTLVLSDSYRKFHNKGIKELYSKTDEALGKLDDIKDTLNELKEFSQSYKTFSGISDELDGEVKFVLKTDEIKAKEEKQVSKEVKTANTQTHEKKSFWKWLLGLLHIQVD
ncbi:hypothetical protein ELD05_01230 [Caldicellulosiruptor changbaiensis]|uniref:YhgE/Pip domain-containing protein n=1 Tax=Caldicellulosiruptor changbaiensis TaxID=1222016 RepID=A0A3T0D2J2_9FIRM|nr:hypothetical protein [Caldicellulosiruptor changbaiensis]AZT89415.1 hypothetical protein ELD05_01230 [Caldicellulosiruptor changbaiensis]